MKTYDVDKGKHRNSHSSLTLYHNNSNFSSEVKTGNEKNELLVSFSVKKIETIYLCFPVRFKVNNSLLLTRQHICRLLLEIESRE